MKQWSLLFILTTFCVLSWAQDSTVSNGYTTFYYPSGVKSSEGILINGKPDGWWKSYDEKGNLTSEGNRKNFVLDSIWTFYEKGRKYLTVNYVNGKKQGEQILYNPTNYIVTHWEDDTIVGAVKTYDNENWLLATVPHVEGKPHGMAKEFNKDGLVTKVTYYYHGILNRSERINRTDKFNLKQGAWKYFWNNGNLKLEGSYVNDKKHGFFKYYDEGGNFQYVEKYAYDELITDAKETKELDKRIAYHTNGKPSIIATYFNDKPEGIRREFDTTGKIIKGYLFENGWLRYEGITDLNGLRQGLWKEYYPTGELRSQGKYKNSKPVGEWNFYFTDKTIEITGLYNNKGEKENEWIWFYPNGDTMIAANYQEGDLDGPYTEYDETGKILVKGTYIAGYEEGDWIFRNGASEERGKYENGNKEGLWISTFDNENVAFKINYEKGILNGKYTSYWENGNIKSTGKYNNGAQDGPWQQYNEDGILFLTTIFADGKEVKWNNYNIK